MKIRLILLSLLGVAAYIMLANFNSKMIKDNPVPEQHVQASPQQPQQPQRPVITEPGVEIKNLAIPPERMIEIQPTELLQTAATQIEGDKQPETPTQQTINQPADAPVTVQLQSELAQKEQQIRQLLEAQDAVAAKNRSLLALLDIGTADVAAKEKMLQEANNQIKTLATDKNTLSTELESSKTAIEQLHATLNKLEAGRVQSEQSIEEKENLARTSHQQIQAKNAEAEYLKAQVIDITAQLKAAREELGQADLKASSQLHLNQENEKLIASLKDQSGAVETALQEKTAALTAAQGTIQSLTQEVATLSQTVASIHNMLDERNRDFDRIKEELGQTDLKATSLLHRNQENEKLIASLKEQSGTVETALQEKTAALTEALATIQSLTHEVAALPQRVASVQNMLDERNRDFDRIKEDSSGRIEQLSQQVGDLRKNEKQATAEINKCKAEVNVAEKKVTELESARELIQTNLMATEKKLAAVLSSTDTLRKQLNDKEAALSGTQAQLSGLLARATSLNDEKIGFASQLEALQADQKNLQVVKASFDEKSAALLSAETRLKDLAVLQAKNAELTKSMEEKTANLVNATKQVEELKALQAQYVEQQTQNKALAAQIEANATTIKQLETEKANLSANQTEANEAATLKQSLREKSDALVLAETKIKALANADEQVASLQVKMKENSAAQQAAEQKATESETAQKALHQSLTAGNEKQKVLETELAGAQLRIAELTDKNSLQQQQDLVANLNQQIATLQSQVHQMAATEALAKKNLSEAAAAMQVHTEATKAANTQMQALQTEKDELQKQLNMLKKSAQPADPQSVVTSVSSTLQDHDKDGVADAVDLCPQSPGGTPVNALGCPEKKGIILEGVNFKSNTAILLADAPKNLDKVAAALNQLPQVKVELVGHTDSVGDPDRNLELSALRAQAVAKYLTEKGVATERLAAKGYGQENPVADNSTSIGRQKNRRVELYPSAR